MNMTKPTFRPSKTITATIFFALAFILLFSPPTSARAAENTDPPYQSAPLCLPERYASDPQDCLVAGPAERITNLAAEGILLPEPPLLFYPVPYEYSQVPYQYIKVTTEDTISVYNNLDTAISDQPSRFMPDGFRYFSYRQRAEPEQGIYYLTKTNEWVWGGDVSRVSAPNYQGMLFSQTPRQDFAFVIDTTVESFRQPGYNQPLSGVEHHRFDVLYVYDRITVDDAEWYRVGVEEWLPKRVLAVVNINPIAPEGVDNGRWIEVDLYNQVLMVYENHQLRLATLVSTGVEPFFTKPGLFKIYNRLESEDMTTSDPSDFYYLEDVPFTQYFDEARALHGIYWHPWLGYQNSHGCVNLSIADAHWIYEWAGLDDWVYVWDPSGATPTDDSFYTAGGP
ncbi:MAG: L,D-transpeptidase [Anaerolineaceae bacterium]|nr:L,D-transpeptidase [Anaerolineaceae bacterium]